MSKSLIALCTAITLFIIYSILTSIRGLDRVERIFYGLIFGFSILYVSMFY